MFRWQLHLKGDCQVPASAPRVHKLALALLRYRVALCARDVGEVWSVPTNGGYRTLAQQQYEWNKWHNVPGHPVAVPGTSNHGRGKAMDVEDGHGKPVGSTPAHRRALRRRGLRLAVVSEYWHLELGSWWRWW